MVVAFLQLFVGQSYAFTAEDQRHRRLLPLFHTFYAAFARV